MNRAILVCLKKINLIYFNIRELHVFKKLIVYLKNVLKMNVALNKYKILSYFFDNIWVQLMLLNINHGYYLVKQLILIY